MRKKLRDYQKLLLSQNQKGTLLKTLLFLLWINSMKAYSLLLSLASEHQSKILMFFIIYETHQFLKEKLFRLLENECQNIHFENQIFEILRCKITWELWTKVNEMNWIQMILTKMKCMIEFFIRSKKLKRIIDFIKDGRLD